MSHKEHDVNRNAWSKVAEKMHFIQNDTYKCKYEKLAVHFLKRLSCFEMNVFNHCQKMFKSFRTHSEVPKNKV